MSALTAADVLRRAAELINEHGWCRTTDTGPDSTDRFTVTEALSTAIRGDRVEILEGEDLELYRQTRDLLRDTLNTRRWLIDWNDAPDRTVDEVKAALLAAAGKAAQS